MKRLMATSLTFMLALGFISCGNNKQPTVLAERTRPITAGRTLIDTDATRVGDITNLSKVQFPQNTNDNSLNTEEGTTDATANTSTTATIRVDDKLYVNRDQNPILFRGSISQSDDVDWIKVTLEDDQMYRVVVFGTTPGSDRTLTTPLLKGLYKGDDDYIAGTSGSFSSRGDKTKVHYCADADAAYYVAVHSFGGETGTYDLHVLKVPDDVQPDNISTLGTITVGGSQDGKINYRGDADWYQADLTGGTTYRMNLRVRPSRQPAVGSHFVPDLSPRVRLYNSTGGYIEKGTENSDFTMSSISYTPAETSTYLIAAAARINRIGRYTLTLSEQ